MNQSKMHLVNKIFNNEAIRTVWDKEQEKYFISVIDIVSVIISNILLNYKYIDEKGLKWNKSDKV